MKALLLLTILFSFSGFSQITINVSDFADSGDTVRLSRLSTASVDPALTGSNYTWDFSNFVAEEQILRTYYDVSDGSSFFQFMFGSFASLDYQATNFAETDAIPLEEIGGFLPVNFEEVNIVSKNTADSITSVGYSIVVEGSEIPFKSDTIETRYKFPMEYGNVYSSRGYSELDMSPIVEASWRQYRERNSHVDGWGTVTTPYGQFQALRVKHVIDEIDSIYMDFGGGGSWFQLSIPTSIIYEWWAIGELEPVMRISTSDFFGSETITGIEYKDIYLGLDASLAEENTIAFEVGPNPFENEVSIKSAEFGITYTLHDVHGQILQNGVILQKEQNLDLGFLAPGGYFLCLRGTDGTFGFKKLIKSE